MTAFLDFLSAALPWLCMGLLLAVFFAKSAQKKKNTGEQEQNSRKAKEDYSLEGMCFGMCFGVALGTAFGCSSGVSLSVGMLAGLVIGSCIEKKENDGKDDRQ